jgi:release factor glutamine methyltransferase
MSTREAGQQLRIQLQKIYSQQEASVLTDWIMQYITGLKKTDLLQGNEKQLTQSQLLQYKEYTQQLMQHEPIQYVLHEAWFCGIKLYVDKNVLIPRPETEELVEWIISNCKFPINTLKILDVGSGSGCIPIALKRKLRKAEVWSCDISEAALQVAKKNATDSGATIGFNQLDFLDKDRREKLPTFDIVVSNPPYVPEKDKHQMQRNVLEYEPATALFVPDNDGLIFYKALIDFGKNHLNKEGTIYAEIHEDMGENVMQLFQSANYSIELKKDMQGKERMLRAVFNL